MILIPLFFAFAKKRAGQVCLRVVVPYFAVLSAEGRGNAAVDTWVRVRAEPYAPLPVHLQRGPPEGIRAYIFFS
jgi:hypothetical protein